MPINSKDIANYNAYKKSVGADNDAPTGTFNIEVERAEVRTNENSGIPSVSTMLRIKGGDHDNKTIFNNLNWFVSPTDRDGDPKPSAKIESGQKFVRQLTMNFFAALYGFSLEYAPDGFLVADPEAVETTETMLPAFDQWADILVGENLTVTVTDSIRDGEPTGFQNMKFAPATQAYAEAV